MTSSLVIVLSNYSCEIYRAWGKPKLSVLSQWLYLMVMWPTVLISVRYGFDTLCMARSLVRFEGLLVDMTIPFLLIRLSPIQMIKNIMPALICSILIMIFALTMRNFCHTVVEELLLILPCILIYMMMMLLFPKERMTIRAYLLRGSRDGV